MIRTILLVQSIIFKTMFFFSLLVVRLPSSLHHSSECFNFNKNIMNVQSHSVFDAFNKSGTENSPLSILFNQSQFSTIISDKKILSLRFFAYYSFSSDFVTVGSHFLTFHHNKWKDSLCHYRSAKLQLS